MISVETTGQKQETEDEKLAAVFIKLKKRRWPDNYIKIVPVHLELERSAHELLKKKGIYPTKNHTVLRVIK